MQIWLSTLCMSMPTCSMLASTFAAHDGVHHCGASATTRGGGQPLHPIFALSIPESVHVVDGRGEADPRTNVSCQSD